MKVLRTVDKIAGGLLFAGAIGSAVMESRKPKSPLLRGMKALVGVAGLYQIIRSFAPKTAEERRAEKLNELFNQVEDYAKKAKDYQQTAQGFLRERCKSLKAATSA